MKVEHDLRTHAPEQKQACDAEATLIQNFLMMIFVNGDGRGGGVSSLVSPLRLQCERLKNLFTYKVQSHNLIWIQDKYVSIQGFILLNSKA